jgi:hypothetical protein
MKREEFLAKYNITGTTVDNYKRKFPWYVFNKRLDYNLMDIEIQNRIDIKQIAQDIMIERKAKDLEFLCNGNNIKPKSHHFLNFVLFKRIEQNLIRDKSIRQFIEIIKRYGKEDV